MRPVRGPLGGARPPHAAAARGPEGGTPARNGWGPTAPPSLARPAVPPAAPVTPGAAPAGGSRPRRAGGRAAAWAQLLRVSALCTVPGDALAGAAAARRGPDRGTALAVGASLCLYEAGMALNDWADRDVDAVERPERPLPSGRIAPAAALAAAGGLTAAGLGLAAAAGRPALLAATALAGSVWAYDLRLKDTPFGPAAMAGARALDLVLGAAATGRGRLAGSGSRAPRRAGVLRDAGLLGAHTYLVTTVSRRETQGASPLLPLTALGGVAALAAGAAAPVLRGLRAGRGGAAQDRPGPPTVRQGAATAAAALAYAAAAARPLARAALNPSPPLLQRAVGGGIRATIPLQAALTARAGGSAAAGLLALLPLARRLSRAVSPT